MISLCLRMKFETPTFQMSLLDLFWTCVNEWVIPTRAQDPKTDSAAMHSCHYLWGEVVWRDMFDSKSLLNPDPNMYFVLELESGLDPTTMKILRIFSIFNYNMQWNGTQQTIRSPNASLKPPILLYIRGIQKSANTANHRTQKMHRCFEILFISPCIRYIRKIFNPLWCRSTFFYWLESRIRSIQSIHEEIRDDLENRILFMETKNGYRNSNTDNIFHIVFQTSETSNHDDQPQISASTPKITIHPEFTILFFRCFQWWYCWHSHYAPIKSHPSDTQYFKLFSLLWENTHTSISHSRPGAFTCVCLLLSPAPLICLIWP